jgi:hypothetical protein
MGTRFSLIRLLILAPAQLTPAVGAHLAIITWDKFGTITSTVANTRKMQFVLKDVF